MSSSKPQVQFVAGFCAGLAVTLVVAATAAVHLVRRDVPAIPHAAAETAPEAAQVVYRDPDTGQLRTPTAEEHARIVGEAPVPHTEPKRERITTRHPSGAVGMVVAPDAMYYSVVRVGPDGGLDHGCVAGAGAAEAFLRGEGAAHHVR